MAGRSSKRRGRDAKGHVDRYHDRRKRYENILGMLGLGELFAAMPQQFQLLFWKFKSPDPALDFEPGFPTDRASRVLRKTIEARYHGASVVLKPDDERSAGGTEVTVSVRDFLSVVAGCRFVVDNMPRARMPEAVIRFLNESGPKLARCCDAHLSDALGAMFHALHEPLLARSRLNVRLFTARPEQLTTEKGKLAVRAVVGCVEPQMRSVTLEGDSRPMYRVAEAVGAVCPIKWVEWDGALLGAPDASKRYPVYVQAHALRRLSERVNFPPAARYLESWLGSALAEPNIVERRGGDLLVEFRLREHRIGYLVATPMDDIVAVRTFLFLTMEETPEGRKLRKRLHLTRRDVDWLKLTDLTTFTETDLRADVELRELLASCGCGHLFELEHEDYAPQPKKAAADMRKYLRIAA